VTHHLSKLIYCKLVLACTYGTSWKNMFNSHNVLNISSLF
jgi:hypothetical protein